MHDLFRSRMVFLAAILAGASASAAIAQNAGIISPRSPVLLPDAPAPPVTAQALAAAQTPFQVPSAAGNPPSQGSASVSAGQSSPPAPPAAGQSSSAPAAQNSGNSTQSEQKTEHEKAEQQLKSEEKQRILGVVPNFSTSYNWNAASLSAGQKLQLAFHSAIDPFTFGAAGVVAGLHEALDEDPGFGWGAAGYGKRAGAAYLDAFDGDMIGNGILPALFHQDPRYFRLGHGSFHHRLFYAVSTSYICRHDNTGKWEPNYSNVGGNIIAGAISNLYYPSQNSGWGQTISNGFIVTTEGTVGGVFDEFWPDIARKVLHKDVTHSGTGAQP